MEPRSSPKSDQNLLKMWYFWHQASVWWVWHVLASICYPFGALLMTLGYLFGAISWPLRRLGIPKTLLEFHRPSSYSIKFFLFPKLMRVGHDVGKGGGGSADNRPGSSRTVRFSIRFTGGFVDRLFVQFGTTFRPHRRHFVRYFQLFLQLRWGKRRHSHSLLTPVGSAD